MRSLGRIVKIFLKKLGSFLRAGKSTMDVEKVFLNFITQYPNVKPAFLGYNGYPCAVCVSVNEEIIHGIPREDKRIKEGDLVSVDIGLSADEVFIDAARTYRIGKISPQAQKLLRVCNNALQEGIRQVKVGATVGDIGFAIQRYVEKNKFSVVRKFVGHGIGKELHCPPEVPNFGERGAGDILEEGMVLAIEPMITSGAYDVEILPDGWTARTRDNSLSCHCEHSVAVTSNGPWILTG